jgi:2-keto-4-pentenoate hydratase
MQRTLDVDAPLTLAKCRRAGTVLNLPLHELKSRTEAEAFQRAAVIALGGETCGHKIGATSIEVQRLLKCQEPIHAPILREHVLASGTTDRIPAGLLGMWGKDPRRSPLSAGGREGTRTVPDARWR